MNFFLIERCYLKGGYAALTTTPHFLTDWSERRVALVTAYEEDYRPLQSYRFFWDETFSNDVLQLAAGEHSLHNGMTTIYRYMDYYDMVSFSLSEECATSASYYLSCLTRLDTFYKDFITNGRHLMQIADKEKIMLPKEKWSEYNEDLFLRNLDGCYEIQGRSGPTHVTVKELMCLKMMMDHHSDHTISAILEENPRAIKNYVGSVRERTGMNMGDIILICRGASFHKGLIH